MDIVSHLLTPPPFPYELLPASLLRLPNVKGILDGIVRAIYYQGVIVGFLLGTVCCLLFGPGRRSDVK